MKIKNSFLLSYMNIFQATCAFIVGCLLSSEVMHLFSCHVVRKHRSTDVSGFTAPNEHRREEKTLQTDHSETTLSYYNLKSADDLPDEGDQFFQRRFRIGCLVLYDVKTPAKVLYTSWIPQCDVNMTLDTRQTFPNPAENASSYFLEEISKLDDKSLDYYVFANHDTYVVMDNLREYLSHCDPDQPMAYGHALLKYLYEGSIPVYTVGGTLVLSREALLRASQVAECMNEKLPTTTTILACLHKSGGNLVDSRDQFTGNTFLAPAKPFQILTASLDPKFVKEQKFSTNYCESVNCLSDFPVAFHQMTSAEIHLTHFLIDWANYSRYTGTNKYSKLRLKFNGSKLPLGPPLNASKAADDKEH